MCGCVSVNDCAAAGVRSSASAGFAAATRATGAVAEMGEVAGGVEAEEWTDRWVSLLEAVSTAGGRRR